MMRFETNIRQERIIQVKVQDDTKPLVEELSADQLFKISQKADYYFIAKGDYFHALHSKIENGEQTKSWEQIFLKGVNLGLAMPGHYPTEFSLTFDGYLEWFRLIGEMNANVIRTYTILPPEFYEAFAYYNLHYNNKKLYLLQGVWDEEPETDNYFYPKASSSIQWKFYFHKRRKPNGSVVSQSNGFYGDV